MWLFPMLRLPSKTHAQTGTQHKQAARVCELCGLPQLVLAQRSQALLLPTDAQLKRPGRAGWSSACSAELARAGRAAAARRGLNPNPAAALCTLRTRA